MKNIKKSSSLILLMMLISACQTPNLSSSKVFSKDSSTSSSSTLVSSSSQDGSSLSTSTSSSNSSSNLITSSNSNNSSSSTTSNSSSSSSSSSTTSSVVPPVTYNKLYDATLESNAPNYYESVRGLKGLALKNALHDLIDGHKEYSYGSSINTYMKDYDQDPDNPGNIMLIYSGSTTLANASGFNKEHVWAKSHGNFGTSKPAGSDLHNLRPSHQQINSTRGSLDFAEGGNPISGYPGNYKTSSTFEPSDEFKGDVARTIFYMATRYDDAGLDLEVEAPTNKTRYLDLSSGATGVHGNFDDLYKWATSGEDPVNNYEVRRNNIIYKDYQKNRNPFVDHPEFIIMIYDKNYNGPGALNDLNPGEMTPEQSAAEVIKLINAIGTITLNSLEKIETAETAYNALSNEAKALVTNYNTLVSARNSYDELYESSIVEHVISLIDSIGEVTVEDKAVIEEAEAAYTKLNNTQKNQITNYNVLVSARETLDEILANIEATNKILYQGIFMDSTGVGGSYNNYTLTLNGKSWSIAKGYKSDNFRLGHNAANTIDAKFYTALGMTSSPDSSVLEMKWDVNNVTGISFGFNGSYGTINKIYILKSTDGGNTYSICAESTFTKGETTLISYSGDVDSKARFALVVVGSKPRAILTEVVIKGLA